MATKKITDLQLISAVTSGISVPSDNGTQSYRFTAAQMKDFILANQNILLAMLKDDIFNGLTQVTADDADFFILNDTSDSNRMKKALVSTFVRNNYSAISGATSITQAGTYRITGASATITLPTAVGFLGRVRLIHGGTNFTQVYTLNTTSSQTIGGVAGGSYALYTNGEMLEIESNGSNWEIVGRRSKSALIDHGATTIGAVTTGPTKGTMSRDKVFGYRDGEFWFGEYQYYQTNTTGANNGSGEYLWGLPSGVTADTASTIHTAYTGSTSAAFASSILGTGNCIFEQTPTRGISLPVLYSSTQFRNYTYSFYSGSGFQSSSLFQLAGGTQHMYTFSVKVKVPGWQP